MTPKETIDAAREAVFTPMRDEPLFFSDKPVLATLYVPKYEWQWSLTDKWDSVVFNSVSAPNAFNRLMQRLILGIHWRKMK